MDPDAELRTKIIDTLIHKANLKQRVSDNTLLVFNELKECLHEFATELDEDLEDKIDKRVRIEYRDRGKLEAQVQIAEDILIFAMQTDVFNFDPQSKIRRIDYIGQNSDNAYCGVINIYNFLADSFKFNRSADEGYLIGRIFINQQMQYFVEGPCVPAEDVSMFGTRRIDRSALLAIIESAVCFALDFDLYVPGFDSSTLVSLEQFNSRTEHSKLKIGKRLGYDLTKEKF